MTKRKDSVEKAIRDIRRATRRQYSAEEKIRIVLEGLRGKSSIAETQRHHPSLELTRFRGHLIRWRGGVHESGLTPLNAHPTTLSAIAKHQLPGPVT